LIGRALGIDPATACGNIGFARGKPTFSAALQSALIARSTSYRYEVGEVTDDRAELRFFKFGLPVGISSYTIAEAKKAGLTSKQVWQAYASDLLFARALTRGVRRYCPDVLVGNAAYTREEAGEDVHEPTSEAAPPASAPGVTDQQISDLRTAKEALHISTDKWKEILAKRGVETARALTEQQAKELIGKLNTLITTKLMEEQLNHEDAGRNAHRNGDLTVDVPVVAKGGEGAKGSTVKSD
jgi:hypothetical protein